MTTNFAFNQDKICQNQVKDLIKTFGIKCAFETGTRFGITTRYLSELVDEVHSAELMEDVYKKAKNLCKDYPNIHLHLGYSKNVLEKVLPDIVEKYGLVFLFLDAHFDGKTTGILDELDVIAKYAKDKAILVIDDFEVPKRRHKFDTYKGIKLNYNYIKKNLDKVYSKYEYFYLNNTSQVRKTKNTGKLYVIPEQLFDTFKVKKEDVFHFEGDIPFSNM